MATIGATDPELRKEPVPPQAPAPPSSSLLDLFYIDVILRLLLFSASLVAVVVIVTGNQTEIVPSPTVPGLRGPLEVKFNKSPAFIYFVVAFSVSGLYSIITALASISVVLKPDFKLKFILYFILWDTLILGIIASATGTAGAIGYVGLKGNNHVGWMKVCNIYTKFCKHVAGSLAVALFGSIVAVLLVWLSTVTIHSKIPK